MPLYETHSGTFTASDGTAVEVKVLWDRDSAPQQTNQDLRITEYDLQWRAADPEAPFVKSDLTVTVNTQDPDLLTEVAEADEGNVFVELYRDGSLTWRGFYLSDLGERKRGEMGGQQVTIDAKSGLGRLSDIEFEPIEDGVVKKGERLTRLNVVSYCLAKLHNVPLRVAFDLEAITVSGDVEDGIDSGTDYGTLNRTWVSVDRYYDRENPPDDVPKDWPGEPTTCDNAIRDILGDVEGDNAQLQVWLDRGRWNVVNRELRREETYPWVQYTYDDLGNLSRQDSGDSSWPTVDLPVGVGQLEARPTTKNRRPLRGGSVEFSIGEQTGGFENASFDRWANVEQAPDDSRSGRTNKGDVTAFGDPIGWTQENGIAPQRYINRSDEDQKGLFLPSVEVSADRKTNTERSFLDGKPSLTPETGLPIAEDQEIKIGANLYLVPSDLYLDATSTSDLTTSIPTIPLEVYGEEINGNRTAYVQDETGDPRGSARRDPYTKRQWKSVQSSSFPPDYTPVLPLGPIDVDDTTEVGLQIPPAPFAMKVKIRIWTCYELVEQDPLTDVEVGKWTEGIVYDRIDLDTDSEGKRWDVVRPDSTAQQPKAATIFTGDGPIPNSNAGITTTPNDTEISPTERWRRRGTSGDGVPLGLYQAEKLALMQTRPTLELSGSIPSDLVDVPAARYDNLIFHPTSDGRKRLVATTLTRTVSPVETTVSGTWNELHIGSATLETEVSEEGEGTGDLTSGGGSTQRIVSTIEGERQNFSQRGALTFVSSPLEGTVDRIPIDPPISESVSALSAGSTLQISGLFGGEWSVTIREDYEPGAAEILVESFDVSDENQPVIPVDSGVHLSERELLSLISQTEQKVELSVDSGGVAQLTSDVNGQVNSLPVGGTRRRIAKGTELAIQQQSTSVQEDKATHVQVREDVSDGATSIPIVSQWVNAESGTPVMESEVQRGADLLVTPDAILQKVRSIRVPQPYTKLTADVSGTVTSLPVEAVPSDLPSGFDLVVTNDEPTEPNTGVVVTTDAAVTQGDTSISIQSTSLDASSGDYVSIAQGEVGSLSVTSDEIEARVEAVEGTAFIGELNQDYDAAGVTSLDLKSSLDEPLAEDSNLLIVPGEGSSTTPSEVTLSQPAAVGDTTINIDSESLTVAEGDRLRVSGRLTESVFEVRKNTIVAELLQNGTSVSSLTLDYTGMTWDGELFQSDNWDGTTTTDGSGNTIIDDPGTLGSAIAEDGSAAFEDVHVRGRILADDGIDGSQNDNDVLTSSDYTEGATGWALKSKGAKHDVDGDGTQETLSESLLEVQNAIIRGTIFATAGEIENLDILGELRMKSGAILRASNSEYELTQTQILAGYDPDGAGGSGLHRVEIGQSGIDIITNDPNDPQRNRVDWFDESDNQLGHVSVDGDYDSGNSQSDATMQLLAGQNHLFKLDGRTGSFEFLDKGGPLMQARAKTSRWDFQTPQGASLMRFVTVDAATQYPYIDIDVVDTEPPKPPSGTIRLYVRERSGPDDLYFEVKEPDGDTANLDP